MKLSPKPCNVHLCLKHVCLACDSNQYKSGHSRQLCSLTHLTERTHVPTLAIIILSFFVALMLMMFYLWSAPEQALINDGASH